jgi:hypothetical protein
MVRMIVLRIIGDASGEPSSFDGQYLKAFDADRNFYNGHIEVTPDKAHALLFNDVGEAFNCWKRQSRTLPLRPDGNPNRPLTAFSATFESAE